MQRINQKRALIANIKFLLFAMHSNIKGFVYLQPGLIRWSSYIVSQCHRYIDNRKYLISSQNFNLITRSKAWEKSMKKRCVTCTYLQKLLREKKSFGWNKDVWIGVLSLLRSSVSEEGSGLLMKGRNDRVRKRFFPGSK